MAEKVYQCQNDACALGTATQRGLFTGGMTAEGRSLLTGEPVENMVEGTDFGDGICPVCGTEGGDPSGDVAGYEEHESVEGLDPLGELHDEIQDRVDDPNDKLDADGAQAALIEAAAEQEASV